MNGTVILVRKKGIRVQMDSNTTPTGNFVVVRKSDGTAAGTVTFRKAWNANGVVNMNWVGTPPTTPVAVGDTVQPI